MAYKSAQTRALVLRGAGWGPEQVEAKIWQPHHQWAGKAMYQLCLDLRGFYLKVIRLSGFSLAAPAPPCHQLQTDRALAAMGRVDIYRVQAA